LSLRKTAVNISAVDSLGNFGCAGFNMTFKANSSDDITAYNWDFGNGITSTNPEPQYKFSTAGSYSVKLNYTTKGGCTGVTTFNNVSIFNKPVADFTSLSGTTICGNSPVSFSSSSGTAWQWDFGGDGNDNISSAS